MLTDEKKAELRRKVEAAEALNAARSQRVALRIDDTARCVVDPADLRALLEENERLRAERASLSSHLHELQAMPTDHPSTDPDEVLTAMAGMAQRLWRALETGKDIPPVMPPSLEHSLLRFRCHCGNEWIRNASAPDCPRCGKAFPNHRLPAPE